MAIGRALTKLLTGAKKVKTAKNGASYKKTKETGAAKFLKKGTDEKYQAMAKRKAARNAKAGAGAAVAGTAAVGGAATVANTRGKQANEERKKRERKLEIEKAKASGNKGARKGDAGARTVKRDRLAKEAQNTPTPVEIARAKSKQDKPKNYNVGVSKGGVSFKEAFAHFRKKGNKTFTWNGKKYTTELKKGKK